MAIPFAWNVYRPQRVDMEGAFSIEINQENNVGIVYGSAEIHDNEIYLTINDSDMPIYIGDILSPSEKFDVIDMSGDF